jgi:hypothetical protein
VESIALNDLDRAIYAFWYAATKRNLALRTLVARTPVTVQEWDRQKAVQREKKSAPLLELGFSTLFLNRTNRSGILRAGMVGGRAQKGKWTALIALCRVSAGVSVGRSMDSPFRPRYFLIAAMVSCMLVPVEFRASTRISALTNGRHFLSGTPVEPGTRKVVGATGFEPATLCSQSRCATRLRYAPTCCGEMAD